MAKTVVVGATDNPERFAFLAVEKLKKYGHEVIPVGIKKGSISGTEIHAELVPVKDVDTVTLYVGPKNQPYWYEYIISLKPRRLIFNPGTENAELEKMAKANGIETLEACTLVMLSIGNY
jgi:uncharacterized protein